ncbi:ABC transporter ATP-binding protein [Azospirillum sp. RWY-5-1]|uniref:ABC transporter ATP-binding protein n=1 Tax=Azospirillum oleiclasticum TaxID=2735135 RepID=A0ABX2T6A1_9PROT|nr:ABC transporter ATP-binding protein [Azospirillum oleiclasticum]NYZ11656.1 ABC transporter ATP-binding protein [Azospirillum oleiclasticum]NYZ18817.1 ABC transporter ATP-binding protein [Azospirillum oleiclasticum]
MTPPPALTIDSATRHYAGTRAPAVDGVSITVEAGEFLALLGPSGCGKSTLLRMIAGFERLDSGRVAVGGRPMSGPGLHVPPEERRIGLVFQSYALWPHMTVAGNVAYPLETAGVAKPERAERVAAALATVGLDGFDTRRPAELSGGQRQRVALARCLVMRPELVLLDEPLANLDVHLRASMEEEFASFHARTGATMVYVTHDQAEAMALATRIAVLDQGRLAQLAAPRDLYREPATPMVAGFVGQGALVPATVTGPATHGRAPVRLLGVDAVLRVRPGEEPGEALVCLRPEDLEPAPDGPLEVRIARAAYKGGFVLVEAVPAGGGPRLVLRLPGHTHPVAGESLRLAIRDGWVVPEADALNPARG